MAKGSYRETTARRAGMKPDPITGHGYSRVGHGKREGLQLKTMSHPTLGMAIATDTAMGGEFFRKGGKLYSFPKGQAPDASFRSVPIPKLLKKAENARNRGPKNGR